MKGKYDNKTLDLVGEKLIRASRHANVDIDAIIGNDKLFDGILARINEDAARDKARLSTFTSRGLATVGSLATMLLIAVFAFSIYKPTATKYNVATPLQDPSRADGGDKPGLVGPPPVAIDGNLSAGLGTSFEKEKFSDIERPEPKRVATDHISSKEQFSEPDDDFVAVSYSGDPAETGGGRIIRVELPRSALFAMGVNIPLENDSPTVKADLLVGRDGVTRAVRVLN